MLDVLCAFVFGTLLLAALRSAEGEEITPKMLAEDFLSLVSLTLVMLGVLAVIVAAIFLLCFLLFH